MPAIVLHQWEMSPFCNKARRCLRHKGLDFRVENYNGLLAARAAKLSAAGTLPVMDYDGQRIADSHAIARFLDDQVPGPAIFPAAPGQRAEARVWEDWADKSLYAYEIYFRMLPAGPLAQALDLISEGRPRWERAVLGALFRRRYPKKLYWLGLGRLPAAEVERQLFEHLGNLDTLLGERDWLVGHQASIADIAVAAQLDELLRTCEFPERIRAHASLMDWLQRLPPAESAHG